MRARLKPRCVLEVRSRAYSSLIQLSGVNPGMFTTLSVQHQSSHHWRTPCCSNGRCRSNHAFACSGSLQSKR